ncbi:MAG: MmcQ/YjbR family DNA-binding protein [Bacteroidales bacterium]|nr:MmcQ/YjbR family DNA-binding protein [Candidatus Liminaster caballi]
MCYIQDQSEKTPERNDELREQFSAVTPAWHWNKKHWSDVYYEQLEDELLKGLIKESVCEGQSWISEDGKCPETIE